MELFDEWGDELVDEFGEDIDIENLRFGENFAYFDDDEDADE